MLWSPTFFLIIKIKLVFFNNSYLPQHLRSEPSSQSPHGDLAPCVRTLKRSQTDKQEKAASIRQYFTRGNVPALPSNTSVRLRPVVYQAPFVKHLPRSAMWVPASKNLVTPDVQYCNAPPYLNDDECEGWTEKYAALFPGGQDHARLRRGRHAMLQGDAFKRLVERSSAVLGRECSVADIAGVSFSLLTQGPRVC